MVGARFQRQVDGGSARRFTGFLKREDFRMLHAFPRVEAAAYDPAVLDYYGADHWIRACKRDPFVREGKRLAHVLRRSHRAFISERTENR